MTDQATEKVDPAHPHFWLVFALPWPDNHKNMNESLLAVAPETIPDVFGDDVRMVLRKAAECWTDRPRDVILFADVTKYLGSRGESWDDLGVNWQAALDALSKAQVLGTWLNATYEAYMLASTNSDFIVSAPNGRMQDAKLPRSIVRSALASTLKKDWADYVDGARDSGLIAEW